MVDAARLRKTVDKVTTLPAGWTAARAGDADATWYQGAWIKAWSERGEEGDRVSEYDDRGNRLVDENRPVTITEQGVINVAGLNCRTAACLAGQGILDYAPAGTVILGNWATLPAGDKLTLEALANRLFGLSTSATRIDGVRSDLYHWSNDADDLRRISEQLIREQGGE